MIKDSKEKAMKFLTDLIVRRSLSVKNEHISAIMADNRIPSSALDYGDEKTTLLCLKRANINIFEGDPNNKFGIYLGEHDGKLVVGINDIFHRFQFNSCELFDSEEEMKNHWRLD